MHGKQPFVALDFETANEAPESACAVGLARVERGVVVRTVTRLIRPRSPRFEFTHIHGITWEDVAREPPFGEVWPELAPLIEGAAFIAAHNAVFDRRVLGACCRISGVEPPPLPFVCTLRLARKRWKRPVGLAALCRRLGIELDHHDLGSDARACARVLLISAPEKLPPSVILPALEPVFEGNHHMKQGPTDFWGKLETDVDGEVLAWHPLVDHCADVAACCEALLEQPVLRRRIARIAGIDDLDEIQRQRLCALAAFHDVGKHNGGFQNKAIPKATPKRGHVGEVVTLFATDDEIGERIGDALDIESLMPWVEGEDGACRLLIASLCHHGRPRSLDEPFPFSIWRSSPFGDPFDGVARLTSLVREWFPGAWEMGGAPLPGSVALQHSLCGLITLADWLGSDTRFFPFAHPPESGLSAPLGRMSFARAQARKALREIGLDVVDARLRLGDERPGFDTVCQYPPRPAQRMVADLPADSGGSITVLEAETGSGKTEAALARFVVLLQAGLVEGLYFALPTRTAATQIHHRVVEATKRAFPDESSRPPVVLAVPGYLRVDEAEGKRLPGFEVLWNDDDRERFRYRGWAAEHPKRYLAGAIVIGTIDQVLLSTLQVPHAHLRAASLLRHFLVIDEVHASDTYMNRLLEDVLRRHLDAGGHVLLMSATLGAETRARLLRPGSKDHSPEPLDRARAAAYPLITHRPLEGEVARLAPEPQRSSTISVERRGIAADPTAVASLALEAAAAGAKVLVLRNTVKDCLATQAALEGSAVERGLEALLFGVEGVIAPHHSRFARDDREALDLAIEARLGKERPPGGCVVVATQTVQQSLDLDADLMITDLCPMDVLLQRLGRLHRHQRDDRPALFTEPRAIVLTPAERELSPLIRRGGKAFGDHGLGTVYEDLRVIEATWQALEQRQTLTIPDQSRLLVESSLHSEVLARIGELGDTWKKHSQWVVADRFADLGQAGLNVVDWSAPFGEQASLFPNKELGRRIQTRLGEGDRRICFDEPFESPFGRQVRELSLPAFLAPPAPDEAKAESVEAEYGTIRFTFGGSPFIYDRWGFRPAGTNEEENHG